MTAAAYGSTAVVQRLVEAGADMDAEEGGMVSDIILKLIAAARAVKPLYYVVVHTHVCYKLRYT